MLYGNFEKLVTLVTLSGLISPAEIKEIAEMSPSENVVEIIMRSKNFFYFFYFLRPFGSKRAELERCGTLKNLCDL